MLAHLKRIIDNDNEKKTITMIVKIAESIYCWDINHALGRITIPEWWDVAERLINVL